MRGTSEPDVERDPNVARSRETGGRPGADRDTGDAATTTGTGENEQFVGRVAGQDDGFAGETGAEARSGCARPEEGR